MILLHGKGHYLFECKRMEEEEEDRISPREGRARAGRRNSWYLLVGNCLSVAGAEN